MIHTVFEETTCSKRAAIESDILANISVEPIATDMTLEQYLNSENISLVIGASRRNFSQN